MSIAFRVDGGRRLGMGHVNRCLSIAKYLNGRSMNCFFLVSSPYILQVVSPYGKAIRINQSSEIQSVARFLTREKDCKVLVIDSKRESISKVLNYAKNRVKTILIDNTEYYKHCDLIILPGLREQFVSHPANALVGPKYVLLNPSFNISTTSHGNKNGRILFSAGSTDKFNITERVLSTFRRSNSKFKMTVILGRFYRHIDRIRDTFSSDPRFHILVDPHDFSELLGMHSLGIITFGISVYEAAAARLPVLVVSHSNENDISARKIEKYSWMKYIGKYNSIDYEEMVLEALALLNDKKGLRRMSEAGKIVDGRGSERVGKAIISLMKDNDLGV